MERYLKDIAAVVVDLVDELREVTVDVFGDLFDSAAPFARKLLI